MWVFWKFYFKTSVWVLGDGLRRLGFVLEYLNVAFLLGDEALISGLRVVLLIFIRR